MAGSPPLGWANGALLEMESGCSRAHDTLEARLYLGIGGDEETAATPLDALVSVTAFRRLVAALDGRGYHGLALRGRISPGQGHCTVVAPLFLVGLRHALAG